MEYASIDQEWDATWDEMSKYRPEMGDKVLCLCPEVAAGEVVEVKSTFYVIRLADGSIDEFSEEDVLKRKAEVAA